MTVHADSAQALIDRIRRKAPEYLDLLTAETDAEFEAAFDAILQRAVQNLEANADKYADLDEDGLSSVLAAGLTIPGITVTREGRSKGHVDLTIDADHCVPARRKLAEAKIYDGYAYHEGGLIQLLGRYTTGRELGGLLLVYVRKRNIQRIVRELRQAMDTHKPCKQRGATRDHASGWPWRFESTHALASGVRHDVSHVGCNLHTSRTP